MNTYTIDEMTMSDLGLNDYERDADNVWELADEHQCSFGNQCSGFTLDRNGGHAAWIGIHLCGDHDEPRWMTPWRVDTGSRVVYVCEDCTMMLDEVLPILGWEKTP